VNRVKRSASVRPAEVSAREALRGLVAFLLMVATLAGMTAGLLYAGERPGPPPAWPRWEDVLHFLGATEPPLSGLRYVVSMAGWLLLAYVGAVLLMRALAGTLVTLTRGAAWAHDLERLADLVTLPWIKRAASGGLMAALLVASLVRVSPELPRPASGHGESAVRVMAPALDMPAAREAVVVTDLVREAPVGAAPEEAAAAVQHDVSGEATAVREATSVSAAGQSPAGETAQEQGRMRPELPAPVVSLPGEERQRDGETLPDGGEEAPPGSLSQQGPGVRLPGQARR
jgi:hypothetical protein